jgi:hypothetical protein
VSAFTCGHTSTRIISTYAFRGPVTREENRAAHGNVCVTDECYACGARRKRNVNRRFEEIGPWGPSRQERIAAAKEAVRLAPIPPPISCGDLHAEVTEDGYILLTGPHQAGCERTLPADWIEAAKRLRRAVAALTAEVQS